MSKVRTPVVLCLSVAALLLTLSASQTLRSNEVEEPRPIQVAQLGKIPGLVDTLPVRNHLQQIGLYYNQYVVENGRPPKTKDEFLGYIKNSAGPILQAIEKKVIVVVLDVRPNPNSVLAYQREASSGQHYVVMGDRSVRTMTTAQLDKAVKDREK